MNKKAYIKPTIIISKVEEEQLLTISNFERPETNQNIAVDNDYYLDPSQAMGKGREVTEDVPQETFGDLWAK